MLQIDSPEIVTAAAYIVGFLVTSLLALNAWFIRRFFQRVDTMEATLNGFIPNQEQKTTGLETDVKAVKDSIKRLDEKMEDVRELRERVAVLEYANNIKGSRHARVAGKTRTV